MKTLLTLSLGANVLLIAGMIGVSIFWFDKVAPGAGASVDPAPTFKPLHERVEPEGSPVAIADLERIEIPEPEETSTPSQRPQNFRELLVELEAMDLRIVPRGLLDELEIPVLDSDGQVTDQVRALLALDEQEAETLNYAIGQIAEELRQLELQNIQVEPISDRSAVVRIPPVEVDGNSLREELRDTIYRQLGDIDGALLWDILNQSKNAEFWSGFGRHGSEISLEVTPGESGDVAFVLERKPIRNGGPSHKFIMYPTDPADAATRLESALGRQDYILEYLPPDLRALLVPVP